MLRLVAHRDEQDFAVPDLAKALRGLPGAQAAAAAEDGALAQVWDGEILLVAMGDQLHDEPEVA